MGYRDEVNEIRLRVSGEFLRGHGIEIGAGSFPQSVPDGVTREFFDILSHSAVAERFGTEDIPPTRQMSEFSARFPAGADFIIAHQVLEHAPDPIGQLIVWHSMLKDDGVMVLSLPYNGTCPDKERPMAPIEHLVMDYLLHRDHLSFESREHIYSFVMGWNDEGVFKGRSKKEVAELAHWSANRDFNDLHWHTFDEALGEQTVQCAALFSGRTARFQNRASPNSENKTLGDLIYLYSLEREITRCEVSERLIGLRALLANAATQLALITS